MSTTTDEISVDLEAADARAAAEAANKGKNGADGAAADDLGAIETTVTEAKDSAASKTPEKQALTTDEGLEKLKRDLENEKSLRQAAEQRANEAARGEATARAETQTSQLDLVKSALERVTADNDTLEGQYAEALAAQDFKAAAKLQRQMSDNSAKIIQLEAGKKALESAPKPVPRAPADPVEQWISNIDPKYPRSREWLRAHPEFVRDSHKNRQMLAAHELALARGHQADTDGYFASIEKTLDLTPAVAKTESQGTDPTADAAQAAGGRSAAPAAAPVSRSNGTHGNRPNVVKLTSEQVEIAKMMGMTPEEYARQVVALKKEGKLS